MPPTSYYTESQAWHIWRECGECWAKEDYTNETSSMYSSPWLGGGETGGWLSTPKRPLPPHSSHAHTHTTHQHSAPHPHAQYGLARGGGLLSRLVSSNNSYDALVSHACVMSCRVECCLVTPLNERLGLPPSFSYSNMLYLVLCVLSCPPVTTS